MASKPKNASSFFLGTLSVLGSLVAFGNLCIVAQDWDFPNFSESKDLAIMTVQLSSFTIPIPDWLRIGAEKRLPVWSGMSVGSGLYISGKWFNYFGILWGVAFDWAYWFMTALCFRTCDYAQVLRKHTCLNAHKYYDFVTVKFGCHLLCYVYYRASFDCLSMRCFLALL